MNAWTGQAHELHSKPTHNLHHHWNQTQHIYKGDIQADRTIGDHKHERQRQQMRSSQNIEQDTQTNSR